MNEILTIDELAALLKMTRGQVYTLTRSRSRARMDNPIPVLKINGNVRFRRCDIEGWLQRVANEGAP
jgi:predicted DNA-binding transcriptional regulator AlpA